MDGRSARRMVAVLFLVVLCAGVGAQAPNARTRPADYSPRTVVSSVAGGDFVLVEDVLPWEHAKNEEALTALGYSYSVVTSTDFATYDLTSARVIVVASDQPDGCYQRLAAQSAKIQSFVAAGGILVAHGFCDCWESGNWNDDPFIPGALRWVQNWSDFVTPVTPAHPILARISDDELDYWRDTAEGFLSDVPAGATNIVGETDAPTAEPCYVEYGVGYGKVLVAMIAMDWFGGYNTAPRARMLQDEMAYALLQSKKGQLAWAGTTGFVSDGVDPDAGRPNQTHFQFRVMVSHPLGFEPSFVHVVLNKNGAPYGTFDMTPGSGSTNPGRAYSWHSRLPLGNYTYRFEAQFADGSAKGNPGLPHPGPAMTGPPDLEWFSGVGYGEGDGVEPNQAYSNVPFVFKVTYRATDGDLPSYVRVSLWRNGVSAGTFTMTPPAPPLVPAQGMTYSLSQALAVGSYEYQFQAADRHGAATGPATAKVAGLSVIANVPTLTWAGTPGFESDGVDPDSGNPGMNYTFKVKVTDLDGSEPSHVVLELFHDGYDYMRKNMTSAGGPITAGRIYTASQTLPIGNWAYRFDVANYAGPAIGDPTVRTIGPVMDAYPVLSWCGATQVWSGPPGYEKDGLEPESGTPNSTLFQFKVRYRSHNGSPASYVHVTLWRNGGVYRTFDMAPVGGSYNPQVGIEYDLNRKLPAGNYKYQFTAEDYKGRAAQGKGTVQCSGPTVTAAGVSVVTALTAAPTQAGAQITFALASSAAIDARILNVAGRPVRTLCEGRAFASGTNTLVWNAQSDSGLSVPNGTYVVEVTAKAPAGGQARALARVTIGR